MQQRVDVLAILDFILCFCQNVVQFHNSTEKVYFIFQENIVGIAWRGAGLSDEQREEMTNREGVASGSATNLLEK